MEDENRDSSNGNKVELEWTGRTHVVICVRVTQCACPAGRIVRLSLSLSLLVAVTVTAAVECGHGAG